jgi:hypothetical protein
MESGELPGSVRECAKSKQSRQIEGAAADRSVTVPGIEDNVAVQQVRWNSSRLIIEDLRMELDLREA